MPVKFILSALLLYIHLCYVRTLSLRFNTKWPRCCRSVFFFFNYWQLCCYCFDKQTTIIVPQPQHCRCVLDDLGWVCRFVSHERKLCKSKVEVRIIYRWGRQVNVEYKKCAKINFSQTWEAVERNSDGESPEWNCSSSSSLDPKFRYFFPPKSVNWYWYHKASNQ